MKKACIAVTALASLCAGCAKQGYLERRARDLADIFTLTLGHGYGAKLRGGPILVGLLDQTDEIGHRGGGGVANIHHSGPSHDHMGMPLHWSSDYVGEDTCWLVYGEEHFLPFVGRRKSFYAQSRGPLTGHADTAHFPLYYYTQLEVVLAAGYSIRLGLNPGELVDFILGWTRIDLFDDDRDPGGEWGDFPLWWCWRSVHRKSDPGPGRLLKRIVVDINSKVYHVPVCRSLARVSAKNRVWMTDDRAAKAAGYRACKLCGGQ